MLGGSICPEHVRKLLDPFAFRLSEALAQAIEDGAIVDLSLVVALWIVRCREPTSDLVLGAEGIYLSVGEVRSIVG